MVLAQQGQTLDWFSLATTLVATLVGGLLARGHIGGCETLGASTVDPGSYVRRALPELGRSYHGWLEAHQDRLGTPVGKEAEDAATKLYRAAVIAGRRELLVVEPIRRLMRERLKASNLERACEIDQGIEERFDDLERYLVERIG